MNLKDFEKGWIEKLRSGGLKIFPDEFLSGEEYQNIDLNGKKLFLGSEFFGEYELLDKEGNIVLRADSPDRAKYYLYASSRKIESFLIPESLDEISQIVRNYEKYLDSILKEMEKEFAYNFSSTLNFYKISNAVFNALNIQRYSILPL